MNSLYFEMYKKLAEFELEHIVKVIDNKEELAKYIEELINERLNLPYENIYIKSLETNFGDRISHILFTFSLGLLLAKFKGLDKLIENEYKKYFISEKNVFLKTWLILSLYHDYGYFLIKDYQYNGIDSLSCVNVKYNILNYVDEENVANKLFFSNDPFYCEIKKYFNEEKTRYSEELYKAYFEMRLDSNADESFEHGILGGYVLFDSIINHIENPKIVYKMKLKKAMGINENNVITKMFYQNICFRIMEHNIWVIDPKNSSTEKLSEVYINNFKKITTDEPLLYLLSLVDTIEFTKRMCVNTTNNKNLELCPSKLSDNIQIEVEQDAIFIKMNSELNNLGYNKWFDGITTLNDWVDVSVSTRNGMIIIK